MEAKNIGKTCVVLGVLVIFYLATITIPTAEPAEDSVNILIKERGEKQGYSLTTPGGTTVFPQIQKEPTLVDPLSIIHFKEETPWKLLFERPSSQYDGSDWSNSGGNAQRNGLSDTTGPITADLLWSGGRSSIISWLPVTEGNRLFVVRQTGWPGSSNDSLIVAMDLMTGEELWTAEIPYQTNDWTTWIAGVKNGQVYASRSGNGASVEDNLYALDAQTGETLWVSTDLIDAGPYDGVVFAPNGDPVIASFNDIWRINAVNGSTVWHSYRLASVSGTCGGALYGDSFYGADVVGAGHVITRFDLNTGQYLYQSPVMFGFTLQNTPFVGPDGTIYLSRSQNNPSVDYFYAFADTGTEFVEKWHIPCAWTTASEFAASPDGSVYLMVPGPRIAKVSAENGSILAQTDILENLDPSLSPHFALDEAGTVFFSNGGFTHGKLSVYTSSLEPLWNTTVVNINIGGPSLGHNGVLVVCGIGTDIRAYQLPQPELTVNASGGLLKVHARITNIGTGDATNLSWTITVQGGLFNRIQRTSTGVLPVLACNDTATVASDGFIIGFGKIDVVVTVDEYETTVQGLVLGPFLFIK